jgi:hypothetical protein
MRHALAQSWKNIFRLFPSESQVKRICAEIELTWPLQRTEFRDADLFETPVVSPSFKHTVPRDVTKIDNSRSAVIEREEQFVTL